MIDGLRPVVRWMGEVASHFMAGLRGIHLQLANSGVRRGIAKDLADLRAGRFKPRTLRDVINEWAGESVRGILEVDVVPSVTDQSGVVAIVFVEALWSGGSWVAFRALNATLESLPSRDGLKLFVLDTDTEAAQQFVRSMGDVPEGWGETYWLVRGECVGKMRRYDTPDIPKVRQITESALERLRKAKPH